MIRLLILKRKPHMATREAIKHLMWTGSTVWLEYVAAHNAQMPCGASEGTGHSAGYGVGAGAGYGDDSGMGYGAGNGYGSGYGVGEGELDGAGYGEGEGSGHGSGSGDGYGWGSGDGAEPDWPDVIEAKCD